MGCAARPRCLAGGKKKKARCLTAAGVRVTRHPVSVAAQQPAVAVGEPVEGRAAKVRPLAAGIEPLTFHELRHSAASRWARQGLSLAEMAQQLGHADIRMTQRYAHLCQQTLANKIRQMPAMGIYAVVSQPDPRPAPNPPTDKIQ